MSTGEGRLLQAWQTPCGCMPVEVQTEQWAKYFKLMMTMMIHHNFHYQSIKIKFGIFYIVTNISMCRAANTHTITEKSARSKTGEHRPTES
jgi:hypothetical protein